MTKRDLYSVSRLKSKITVVEQRIANLRLSAENLVPVPDNMPHATEVKRRVEKLALRLVEEEQKLTALCERLIVAKANLIEKIFFEISRPEVQKVAILRYVECLSYNEIAQHMNFSLRHVYRLHGKIFKHVSSKPA